MEAVTGANRGSGDPAAPPQGARGVVVLGAGRSGTSAITRAFVAAGFFAGREEELLGAAPSNPVGHYEPLPVLRMNERLLERLDCGAPTREQQLALRDELVPQLRKILDSLAEKADGVPLAVKEPRINPLLPLWGPVIDGVLHPVLAVRDPLEVARSVARRDETPVGHALAVWEVQTAMALGWLDARTTTVAHYSQLVTDPDAATELVRAAATHLGSSRVEKIEAARAASALQPDLRNQSADERAHAEYLTLRQAELWRYLADLPAGDSELRVPAHLREPSAAAVAATQAEDGRVRLVLGHDALSTAYNEATARTAELEQSLGHCQRELENVRRALSWRLTAPLRRLARLLRRS